MLNRRKRNYEGGLRERARELRHLGLTYREIVEALGIDVPKSTLNHWVSDILLTAEQQARIIEKDHGLHREDEQAAYGEVRRGSIVR
jgi:hypothetical protein